MDVLRAHAVLDQLSFLVNWLDLSPSSERDLTVRIYKGSRTSILYRMALVQP